MFRPTPIRAARPRHVARALLGAPLVALWLAGCASSPTQESTGQYIDNSVLTARVKSAFAADDRVKATNINVESFKGRVQLSGYADSREEINRAVQIARSTPGVQEVQNDIRLKTG